MLSKRTSVWITRLVGVTIFKLGVLSSLFILSIYVLSVRQKIPSDGLNVMPWKSPKVYSAETDELPGRVGTHPTDISPEVSMDAHVTTADNAHGNNEISPEAEFAPSSLMESEVNAHHDEHQETTPVHKHAHTDVKNIEIDDRNSDYSSSPKQHRTHASIIGENNTSETEAERGQSAEYSSTITKAKKEMISNGTSRSSSQTENIKTILLWNHFFLRKDFGLELGTELFEGVQCKSTCNITTDQRALETADSVVMHTFHLMKDLKDATIPQRASQRQIFVFMLLENPQRSQPGLINLPYNDLFNVTLTYLDDPQTDLYTPYGNIRKREAPVDDAVPTLTDVNGKNKSVAWLISNCHAPSARYEYVDILSEFIDVDIIGKCGEKSCTGDCMEFMDRQYLFYLAFENGYCKDYVTEKVFRTLRYSNMIPVVLGGANYSKIFPAKSYIDVRDYKSPEELAEHLKYLSDNRDEYLEYFQWKRDYHVVTLKKLKFLNFCKLCSILYQEDYPFKQNFKPLEYWNPELCLTGDDEREAVNIF